jgi:hypothetical protein
VHAHGRLVEHVQAFVPARPMGERELARAAFDAFARGHEAITRLEVAWRCAPDGPSYHRSLECSRTEGLSIRDTPGEGARMVRLRDKLRPVRDVTTCCAARAAEGT